MVAKHNIKEGLLVKNAGLVLVNNYTQTLFERLRLVNNKVFIDTTSQLNAVHYLQYIVTGLSNTSEQQLILNKLLCGLDILQPIPNGVEITEEQKKLILGLIQAMIAHWPAIGECSTDGFRGNWLVRDGNLVEHENKWELTVEKRAYDILLNKSPFSFSIIKYPWMVKPLHVNWSY